MFDTLSDRLSATFKNLRGKGRLSEADIDATAREIRIALLEADVALPVVRTFIKNVKERALGADVSRALNPAQQVLKIVNEELVTILGGETRRLRFAKNPPTVIMLAGLQGAGKTGVSGAAARREGQPLGGGGFDTGHHGASGGGHQQGESAAAAEAQQPRRGAHFQSLVDGLVQRNQHPLLNLRPVTRACTEVRTGGGSRRRRVLPHERRCHG